MILCPTCPLCSKPPELILADGHQCFCGTDDCLVLTWDAHQSLEWNLTSFEAPIDLPDLGD